jgi:Cu/Ag efflux protein CusF
MIRVVDIRTKIFLVAICGLCCLVSAEDSRTKTGVHFVGEVQSVDAAHHTATVKHVEIPGYAAQGTSEYSIDDEAVLKKLRPGDDIRATVYPGDRTLHNMRIVYRRSAK